MIYMSASTKCKQLELKHESKRTTFSTQNFSSPSCCMPFNICCNSFLQTVRLSPFSCKRSHGSQRRNKKTKPIEKELKHVQVPVLKKFPSSSETTSDDSLENFIFCQCSTKREEVMTCRNGYNYSDQNISEKQSHNNEVDSEQWLQNIKNFRESNWFDCHAETRSLHDSVERFRGLSSDGILKRPFSLPHWNCKESDKRLQKLLQAFSQRIRTLSSSTENHYHTYMKSNQRHNYLQESRSNQQKLSSQNNISFGFSPTHAYNFSYTTNNKDQTMKSVNRLRADNFLWSACDSLALRYQKGVSKFSH